MATEGCQPDSYDYFVTSNHTILFNEYREIQAQYTDSDYDLETGTLQQHNDPEGTPVLSEDRLYHAVYAKAGSEKTAARFLTEQKHMTTTNDLFDKTGSKEKPLTAEGFDTAEYLCTYDLADQYLFLRKGNIIEYIHYEGPENLESHAAAIMRDLDN